LYCIFIGIYKLRYFRTQELPLPGTKGT